eukprot:7843260-Pyramimonas_sp.AAC.1
MDDPDVAPKVDFASDPGLWSRNADVVRGQRPRAQRSAEQDHFLFCRPPSATDRASKPRSPTPSGSAPSRAR